MTEDRALVGCVGCSTVFTARPADLSNAACRVRCPHCGHEVAGPADLAAVRRRTAAFALAALVLYPPAVLLPVMRIDRLGASHETGILDGVATLVADGHAWLAAVVFVASVLVPLAKLVGLLGLSTARLSASPRTRMLACRWLEHLGRWGMLDVLLVAGLVAIVKLGDLVRIEPGPGAAIFATMVVCSLLASAVFDPRAVRLEGTP